MKKLLLSVFFAMSMTNAFCSDGPVLIVNGQVIEHSKVKFEPTGEANSELLLTFEDGTKMTVNPNEMVTIVQEEVITSIMNARFGSLAAKSGDRLTIQGASEGSAISIYNTEGKLLLTKKASAEAENVDLSSLPAGIYMLKVNKSVVKFVK